MLLGIPPDWYKSRNYRSRMVREPRQVLSEFGLVLSEKIQIRVHDSSADMRYMVLPMRPAGTEGWSEERLAALVNRDSMIGVAVPKGPND
jgi:nitrile hydratase